jgi:hypothetical protein
VMVKLVGTSPVPGDLCLIMRDGWRDRKLYRTSLWQSEIGLNRYFCAATIKSAGGDN